MKAIQDRSDFCIDNKFGIYNDVVKGMFLTDIDEFEGLVEEYELSHESEFYGWGGKRGFMNYLETCLREEDKHFQKNPREISMTIKRYQDFCDDAVLYEAIRVVVNRTVTQVVPLDELATLSKQVNGVLKAKNTSQSTH